MKERKLIDGTTSDFSLLFAHTVLQPKESDKRNNRSASP